MMNQKKNFVNAVAMDCYALWNGNIPNRIPEQGYNKAICDNMDKILDYCKDDADIRSYVDLLLAEICSEAEKRAFVGGFNYALALAGANEDSADQEPETPEEETPQGTLLISARTVEQMAADKAAFENSPEGQNFITKLKEARAFSDKHNKRDCLYTSQLEYLANKHQNNLINGSFDVAALYYMHGFKDGQAAAKKAH